MDMCIDGCCVVAMCPSMCVVIVCGEVNVCLVNVSGGDLRGHGRAQQRPHHGHTHRHARTPTLRLHLACTHTGSLKAARHTDRSICHVGTHTVWRQPGRAEEKGTVWGYRLMEDHGLSRLSLKQCYIQVCGVCMSEFADLVLCICVCV